MKLTFPRKTAISSLFEVLDDDEQLICLSVLLKEAEQDCRRSESDPLKLHRNELKYSCLAIFLSNNIDPIVMLQRNKDVMETGLGHTI